MYQFQISANKISDGTFTAGNEYSFHGSTITNLGTVTTADINGGSIDGTSIGIQSPSVGHFTSIQSKQSIAIGDQANHFSIYEDNQNKIEFDK